MISLLHFYFSKHYQVINPEINVTILHFGSNPVKKKKKKEKSNQITSHEHGWVVTVGYLNLV